MMPPWAALSIKTLVVAVALGLVMVQRSVWWATYDLDNCQGCASIVDWAEVKTRSVTAEEHAAFDRDGATVLPSRLPINILAQLDRTLDGVSDTLMTSLVTRFVMPQYARYEHMLHTRSELVRDFAVEGPFGAWAAQVLGAKQVRLYNAELIFHAGPHSPTCKREWHHDSQAAPFAPEVPAVVFTIYLTPIDGESDGPIFEAGSHTGGALRTGRLVEPRLRLGDVLVHRAGVNHTAAGRACFRWRSLQLRYVATDGGVPFSFGPSRLVGPIAWTLAHAETVAPHGLREGDELGGPWYPQVFPTRLVAEKVRVGPKSRLGWSPRALFTLMHEANATKMFAGDDQGIPSRSFLGIWNLNKQA